MGWRVGVCWNGGTPPGSMAVQRLEWGPEMMKSEVQWATEVREPHGFRKKGLRGSWEEVRIAGGGSRRWGLTPVSWDRGPKELIQMLD